jgi:ADP-heptose:LPS heptosyltransferase/GT2 family glycosyltransferase
MPLSLVQPQRPDAMIETQHGRLIGFADRIDRQGAAGWAFDPDHPNTRVPLEIVDHDEVIGELVADRFRDGLAEAGIGDGHHSFEVEFAAPLSPLIRHVVRIRRKSDKQELRQSGVVLEPDPARLRPAAEAIRFHIDHPVVAGGRAELPSHGGLFIEGWAVADRAVASIEVFLDGASLGHATHGLPRKGVQEAFPDRPNALLSGFAFSAPRRPEPGRHEVSIAIRDIEGTTRAAEFALEVLPASREPAAWSLRRHVALPELALKTAALSAAGFAAEFLVLLRAEDDSPVAPDRVRATLSSLSRQAYPEWRLAFLLPEGAAGLQRALLDEFTDIAAKTVPFDQLDDIALSSGTADNHCTYTVPLSAGDELGADALLELALAAAECPEVGFLYGDERRVDPASGTVGPYFKPDWSPELLLSTNYIGRVWAASIDLLRRAGTGLSHLAESSEYDSVLRLTEAAAGIGHVPKVLCARGPARLDDERQERAALAGAAARRGIEGTIEPGCLPGFHRLKRTVRAGALVSIVMPTAGVRDLFKTAITTLRALTRYRDFEIILVENIPAEDTAAKQWAAENADTVVSMAGPFNWSRFSNAGVARAKGEFLLFLNDDIEVVAPDWLDALLEHAARPEIGIVGPQLLYPDGTVQHAGMFLSETGARHAFRFLRRDASGPFGLALTQREVIAVTGASMMIRRDTFTELGGFDEAHEIINNDLDFCLRAHRAGLRTVFTPYATLIHHEKASRALLDETHDAGRFAAAWGERLAIGDPFFNPYLSKSYDDYVPDPEPVELVYPARPWAPREAIRRILVLKLDEIGDFVTALPALRRLKLHFPAAELTILVPPASQDLSFLEQAVDRVIPSRIFEGSAATRWREPDAAVLAELSRQLRPDRFDLAIDMRRQPETRFLLQHTGARWLAGFDTGGRFPWLDIVAGLSGDVARTAKQKHVTEDMLSLVDTVAAAFENPAPARRLPPAEARRALADRADMAEILAGWQGERIVGIHPAAGAENRQWPAQHFAALIDLLAAEEGMRSLIVGSPEDGAIAQAVLAQAARPDAVRSLVGRTGVGDLPLVLQACDLFVGNNSGPQHLAASLGVATVCIHSGVIDPREWGPMGPLAVSVRREMICSPCYLAHAAECHRDLACLRRIEPRQVLQACRMLLRAANSMPSPSAGASESAAGVP